MTEKSSFQLKSQPEFCCRTALPVISPQVKSPVFGMMMLNLYLSFSKDVWI